MAVRAACPKIRPRRVLPMLVLSVSLAAPVAEAQSEATTFALDCATKEIAVITAIEEHGAADDVLPIRLSKAGHTMFNARMACYEGRVGEAVALYDSILFDLGPIASVHQK
ncbi:MAG TPA: hypothetical protein VNQ56_08570 [Pseudolabrys sp.]|nr:hypothetical protein [Pseudolabrys sp.]